MRLTRIAAAELRRDGAMLIDAMKARGFFPGPRAVLLEDAGDGLKPLVSGALDAWQQGDAQLIVTAQGLAAKSALRKLFEDHRAAAAIAVYDDPPSQTEIEAELKRAGLGSIPPQTMRDLVLLSKDLDPGDFRQTIEKIGLYKWRDPEPLSPAEVALCAPSTIEAGIDDVLNATAEGRRTEIGGLMRRLEGQGITPVALMIQAMRHFRTLQMAASDPRGPEAGIQKMRPPVFGPRRDRILAQARGLGLANVEQALALVIETDLTLRSASKVPGMALVERMLLRLAGLARARR